MNAKEIAERCAAICEEHESLYNHNDSVRYALIAAKNEIRSFAATLPDEVMVPRKLLERICNEWGATNSTDNKEFDEAIAELEQITFIAAAQEKEADNGE